MGPVKIADVAASAGVSPATIHYHFGDLSGLVLASIEQASIEFYLERKEVVEGVINATDKLRELIRLGIPDVASPALVMMYTATQLIRADDEALPSARAHVRNQVDLYQSVIDAGIECGDFQASIDTRTIASHMVALEDAHDLYLVLGIVPDGKDGRRQLEEYAAMALSLPVSLTER